MDFTYVPTWSGMAFTAFVADACSRRIVGWRTADAMPTELPLDALEMACGPASRPGSSSTAWSTTPTPGASGNYTSHALAATIGELGMRQSMGRAGVCYDCQCHGESFFAALKNERVHRTVYLSRTRARADISRYIDRWYNCSRLHSGLGYNESQVAP